MAKPKAHPPSVEEASAEAARLWATYRELREREASEIEIAALRGEVKSAAQRARRRAAEAGFSTLRQQLVDLGEYLRQITPRGAAAPPSAEELTREVEVLSRDVGRLGDGMSPQERAGLSTRAAVIHRRIEDARARSPDDDADHDAYVDVEEPLWDLEARLRRERP